MKIEKIIKNKLAKQDINISSLKIIVKRCIPFIQGWITIAYRFEILITFRNNRKKICCWTRGMKISNNMINMIVIDNFISSLILSLKKVKRMKVYREKYKKIRIKQIKIL